MLPEKLDHIKALNGMAEVEWRFWSKVDTSGDCWEWTGGKTPQGYGMFALNGRLTQAHRAAWYFVYGELLSSVQVVMHQCDNPGCVNPNHLKIGTYLDNTYDMIEKGRGGDGSKKLNLETANAIRDRYKAGGITQHQLASEYRVTLGSVRRVLLGESWTGKPRKSSKRQWRRYNT